MSNRGQSQSKCCCSSCGACSYHWYREVKSSRGLKCRRCGGKIKLAKEVEGAALLDAEYQAIVRVPVPSPRERIHRATSALATTTSEQRTEPIESQPQPDDFEGESIVVPPNTSPLRSARKPRKQAEWRMTGQCLMPTGKHAGRRLSDVPLRYLIRLSQEMERGRILVGGVEFKNELQRYLRNLP